MATNQTPIVPRLLSKRQVGAYLNMSSRTLDRVRQADPTFPSPDFRLTPQKPTWDRLTIDAWLDEKKQAVAA